MEIFKILVEYFSFFILINKGYIYKSQIFGSKSGVLFLKNDNLKIKLITDIRDGFYLEIGSLNYDDWFEFSVLYTYIHRVETRKLNPKEVAKLFQAELKKIEGILSSELSFGTLLNYKNERSRKRYK